MELTEAQDIKKRWQEYTEELYKKDLCDPVACSLPGSSVHGIYQAIVLGWIAISFSREEYTEELYKKDLHDPDNHDGVITHLEPEILECEVK